MRKDCKGQGCMEIVAKIEHLDHVYPGGVKALTDINLELYKQEITAIVGQNGSGKTTLSKHFNGLLRPTRGSITVNGKDVAKKRVSDMAKDVGYVFQNPNYQLFCATVREEVKFGLRNLKLSEAEVKKRSKEVLERFSLTELAKEQPVSLSGGTKKIVALASVYAMEPCLLFLDEPTTGQDQPGKTRLGELMQEMKQQGKTVVVITHDMNFVADYVERVIVMAKGRILKDGTPAEIFSDEEVMAQAHIQPPQIYAVANYLRKQGINLESEGLTPQKLAKLIAENGLAAGKGALA